jgi:hypothetical protein
MQWTAHQQPNARDVASVYLSSIAAGSHFVTCRSRCDLLAPHRAKLLTLSAHHADGARTTPLPRWLGRRELTRDRRPKARNFVSVVFAHPGRQIRVDPPASRQDVPPERPKHSRTPLTRRDMPRSLHSQRCECGTFRRNVDPGAVALRSEFRVGSTLESIRSKQGIATPSQSHRRLSSETGQLLDWFCEWQAHYVLTPFADRIVVVSAD